MLQFTPRKSSMGISLKEIEHDISTNIPTPPENFKQILHAPYIKNLTYFA